MSRYMAAKGPEDYDLPDDKAYQNKCGNCGILFIGYKMQHQCKICTDIVSEFVDSLPLEHQVRFSNMHQALGEQAMKVFKESRNA